MKMACTALNGDKIYTGELYRTRNNRLIDISNIKSGVRKIQGHFVGQSDKVTMYWYSNGQYHKKMNHPFDIMYKETKENERKIEEQAQKLLIETVNNTQNEPTTPVADNINPEHYKTGGIETWDYLKAKLSPTELAGFVKANVIKYVSRCDHKDKVQDIIVLLFVRTEYLKYSAVFESDPI